MNRSHILPTHHIITSNTQANLPHLPLPHPIPHSTHTTTHYTTLHHTAADQTPLHPSHAQPTRGVPTRQRASDFFSPGATTTSLWAPQHRVFLLYTPQSITFNPDSGATDILIRRQDSHVLHSPQHLTDANPAPTFYVANNMVIYPYATGTFRPPHTTLTILAYIFEDDDLADNLFGLAPLLNQGCTATFTGQSVSITGPPEEGNQLIFYGTKPPYANAWKFSLPRPTRYSAQTIVRHESHAEIALYASAVFGNPTFKTFSAAVRNQWLSNYPDLTLKMLNANKPHFPATGLGHITASRANVRSTRAPAKRPKHKPYTPTPSLFSAF
jgi:hypothetical protein